MKDQIEVVKHPVVEGDSSAQFRERQDVIHFHQKFGVPVATEPSFLNCEAYAFRVKFMQEELDEFREAHSTGDMHGAADALVDLAYVVHGTAHMMACPGLCCGRKCSGPTSRRFVPRTPVSPNGARPWM